MSDLESLLLILLALYGSECVLWVRRDAACVRRMFGRSFRFVAGNRLAGGDSGGALLVNPLPPFGAVFRAQLLPLSLSPDGVLAFTACSYVPGPRPAQSGRWLAFADAPAFRADERRVLGGDEVLVTVGSTALARHAAALLEKLRRMPSSARAAAIDAEIERAFDPAPLRSEIERVQRASGWLTALASVQFVLLLVVLPASVAWNVLDKTWPLVVLGVPLCSAAIVRAVWRVRKERAPSERSERWKAVLLLAVSPLATVRARDSLTLDLAATHHPLAPARVVCSDAEFARAAAMCLRDARAPYWPEQPALAPVAARAELYWRERIVRALERCVGDVRGVLAPPAKLAPDCVENCARCRHQYVRADSACSDCGDRPVTPFAASALS